MNWFLPEGASTFAADIDRTYYIIFWITAVAFVIVEATLIWFMIRYRARPGRKAYYTHGNVTAEIIWTAVPAVVVVMIGILSGVVWNEIRGRKSVPAGALPIAVEADGVLDTPDDFTTRNRISIPVNTPIVVYLTSIDVIHSFFIPAFRVKQDAVPGMRTPVWFEATATGDFALACAELCGNGHTTMGGTITVLSQQEYASWLSERNLHVAAR